MICDQAAETVDRPSHRLGDPGHLDAHGVLLNPDQVAAKSRAFLKLGLNRPRRIVAQGEKVRRAVSSRGMRISFLSSAGILVGHDERLRLGVERDRLGREIRAVGAFSVEPSGVARGAALRSIE